MSSVDVVETIDFLELVRELGGFIDLSIESAGMTLELGLASFVSFLASRLADLRLAALVEAALGSAMLVSVLCTETRDVESLIYKWLKQAWRFEMW